VRLFALGVEAIADEDPRCAAVGDYEAVDSRGLCGADWRGDDASGFNTVEDGFVVRVARSNDAGSSVPANPP